MGTSIALDSSNHPRISYYDAVNGVLKYAAWTGSGWSIQVVDNSGDVGSYNSLALDSTGAPHISYYDTTNHDLKYAVWSGAIWTIQTLDSEGDVGSYSSLALTKNDIPNISYYDATNGALKYATGFVRSAFLYVPAVMKKPLKDQPQRTLRSQRSTSITLVLLLLAAHLCGNPLRGWVPLEAGRKEHDFWSYSALTGSACRSYRTRLWS